MDIKDKLRLLESLPRNRKAVVENTSLSLNVPAAAASPDISQVSTPLGSFSLHARQLPSSHEHGSVSLGAFIQQQPELLAVAGCSGSSYLTDLRKTVFVDTETTGLSGGAGTCAFLIGIGYFQDDVFCLTQYLMNDFNEEPALYHALNQFIEKFELVVTYNGKSFDMPLINSRNVFLGTNSSFATLEHFDLLHAVRRLWSHRMPDCTLETSEMMLLGHARSGDIPGYLIPYRFFDYLRTRDFDAIKPVLYHNRQDILSMVALTTKMLMTLSSPHTMCNDTEDTLRIGNLFERVDKYEAAIGLYHQILSRNIALQPTRQTVLIRMALCYKKTGDWQMAAQTWQDCIETERYHPLPYIELAKHYEHKMKNPFQALSLVNKALSELAILDNLNQGANLHHYRLDLEYRRQRLKGKVSEGSE